MREGSQEKLSGKGEKPLNGWDRAIAEAREQIAKLQNAIGIFEDMKARGEPFPSEGATKTVEADR